MTPLPLSVLIPTEWTPEQALAVLELLNDLRDALWALHGDRIQDHLKHHLQSANTIVPGEQPDPAF